MYGGLSAAANATAGRSLEGVRDTAVVALGALNATARVLEQVRQGGARVTPRALLCPPLGCQALLL